jgi:hypothetical protein
MWGDSFEEVAVLASLVPTFATGVILGEGADERSFMAMRVIFEAPAWTSFWKERRPYSVERPRSN